MEKVKLIIVAQLNPDGKAELAHYMEQMKGLYAQAQALPLSKDTISETLIGAEKPHLVATIEFPNKTAIHDLFGSDEYKHLLPYREKAFLKVDAFISE